MGRFFTEDFVRNPLSNLKLDEVKNEVSMNAIDYPSIDPRQLHYLQLKNKFALGLDKLRRNSSNVLSSL